MTGEKVVGWNVESNAVGRGLAPAEAYKFSTVQSPLRRAERATSPIGRGFMKVKKNKKGGEQNCSSPMRRLFCFSVEGSLTAVILFFRRGLLTAVFRSSVEGLLTAIFRSSVEDS